MVMKELTPIYRQFRDEGIDIRPLLQIHDDLVWEVEEGALWYVVPVIKSVMESAVRWPIPTPVDMRVSAVSWGDLKGVE